MRQVTGWLLIAIAAFMLIGYLGADVEGPAAISALLLTVVLPAAGGVALVTTRRKRAALGASREELRQQTVESELVRLAGRQGGRLTIIEAVAELGVSSDEAKSALDSLAVRGLADFQVTESGVVVYVFHDLLHGGEKTESRDLLA